MFPILIFCDGATSGNPGPSGWGAIVVLPRGEVRELGGREANSTNNRMEMTGALEALRSIRSEPGPVSIYTDSTYVIRGITQWIWGWRSRGWKTAEGKEVANSELWKALAAELAQRGKENPVDWRYVRGHVGVPGNERVDAIAVEFSKGRRPRLYSGPLLGYEVPVHDIPENTDLPDQKPIEKKEKIAAYSYLSEIGGIAERHADWASCEKRVKGRSGARFKKAMSEEEEKKILSAWGIPASKVRG